MSKNKTWDPPGWPWELDILAIVFVVISLVVPYLIFSDASATASSNQAAFTLNEQRHVLWAIGIVVLFVMHLAVAGASLETISTPFIHIVTPVGFALIAYYRTFSVAREVGKSTLATGSILQIVVLVLAVFLATLLVARIRMARYFLRFRDVKWDIISPSRYDGSYLELMSQLRPLIYPPRLLRATTEGMLIEGWFYIMPVPFAMVQSITAVNSFGYASSGTYYASSTSHLIRLELLDSSEPIFVSPAQRDEFLQYCAHHVARLRPAKGAKTRPGTHGGHDRAHQTHNGAGTT